MPRPNYYYRFTMPDGSTREMSRRLREIYDQAVFHNFDDALGRAVYAANRRANGGFQWLTDVEIMVRAKPGTAQKWREHWLNGGSVKSLNACSYPPWRTTDPEPEPEPVRRAITFGAIR